MYYTQIYKDINTNIPFSISSLENCHQEEMVINCHGQPRDRKFLSGKFSRWLATIVGVLAPGRPELINNLAIRRAQVLVLFLARDMSLE